jgi:hypothetical protein
LAPYARLLERDICHRGPDISHPGLDQGQYKLNLLTRTSVHTHLLAVRRQ